MSSQCNSPETIAGPLYVTSERSVPLPLQDKSGVPITGSAYMQGPVQLGDDKQFPFIYATLMVGPLENNQATNPIVPGALCTGNNSPYSLCVKGNAVIFNTLDASQNINAGNNIIAQGEVMSRCGTHILSAKKNFDIPHPSKEGWRLRHTCPESPYNDVYIRGRVKNKNTIDLPDYWEKFVDFSTITISLTPFGSHQDVIVKRMDKNQIHLQSKGNMPIDCFYHIFAERKDGEKLISEYEGSSPSDYPGNNDEYSISGYHYDIKE